MNGSPHVECLYNPHHPACFTNTTYISPLIFHNCPFGKYIDECVPASGHCYCQLYFRSRSYLYLDTISNRIHNLNVLRRHSLPDYFLPHCSIYFLIYLLASRTQILSWLSTSQKIEALRSRARLGFFWHWPGSQSRCEYMSGPWRWNPSVSMTGFLLPLLYAPPP